MEDRHGGSARAGRSDWRGRAAQRLAVGKRRTISLRCRWKHRRAYIARCDQSSRPEPGRRRATLVRHIRRRAASGRGFAALKGHKGWVSSAAFSPDGTQFVTASVDNTARLTRLSGRSCENRAREEVSAKRGGVEKNSLKIQISGALGPSVLHSMLTAFPQARPQSVAAKLTLRRSRSHSPADTQAPVTE